MEIEGVAYPVHRSSTKPQPDNDESAPNEDDRVAIGGVACVAKTATPERCLRRRRDG